ncbi:ATP-dependent DNA helicase RecG [Pararobbsia alpina]|uniref:ATP-dependent DNA helicase RecG n=1 Tax=Pararobbsia alpina TaxID=621374 RepID=A0A6S7AU35_9BURK|nr:ATP-dependent DNA helicase RecG [Pararobbsia alpina]CAB3777089.1 ATP-dependent DNA helicase RecG [Pararobbsia alpina]
MPVPKTTTADLPDTDPFAPTGADEDAATPAGKAAAREAKGVNDTGAGKKSARKAAKKGAASETTADKLVRMGLARDIDLALHLPMRYEDETELTPVGELLPGQAAQVEGVVVDNEITFRPRRQMIVKIVDDLQDVLTLRFLNFYGSQTKQLAVGARVRARGDARGGFFGMEMVHPAYRIVAEGDPLPQVLTPVYPSTAGITQAYLRKSIERALARTPLPEILPEPVSAEYLVPMKVPALAQAVRTLHHPDAHEDENALMDGSHPAWLRIKFDELLAQQLSLQRAHETRRARSAPLLTRRRNDPASLVARFEQALPFALTGAQQRVWAEIGTELEAAHPMQRLLQGDVGSGKTIVAALAAAQAIDAGYQAALMAPTEILAEQHARKLRGWLEPLGVQVAWLAGSLKAREKRAAVEAAASGAAQLVIGTHALVQDTVDFARLGLVIVDEQHRFGVAQRLALRAKAKATNAAANSLVPADTGSAIDEGLRAGAPVSGKQMPAGTGHSGSGTAPAPAAVVDQAFQPHQLMMSATPIPRTLAMTYYADLDVSTLDELPPGRTPVLTKLVSDARRDEVIARVRQAALAGRQVYWVCPLIEESEALQLQTAVDTYATLAAALPELQVGLVHGRLPPAEKASVMDGFTENRIQLLVATTVIEVGVDVPNASLMVIEHAERFGLAQLHQLRGRVGRGSAASVCVLMYATPLGQTARARLATMRETSDGFEIARRDLEIRGPGEFLGARQSGAAMLRFADINDDAWMIEPARSAAARLLREFPQAADAHLNRWLGGREHYLKA